MASSFMDKRFCPYCGNNPVNHFASRWTDNFVITFTPLTDYIFRGKAGILSYKIIDTMLWSTARICEMLGLIKFTDNLSKTNIARARVLWEDAVKRGIKMEGATVRGRYSDLYRAFINGRSIHFNGLPRPKKAESHHLFTLDDKALMKKKLQTGAVPTPSGGNFVYLTEAKKIFNTLNKPLIVKPRLGSRGRHTTTHIYTIEQLTVAFKMAKQLCRWVIIEEQLFGNVYRGTVINGKLVGILGGTPPKITGDGISTIKKLIAQKNLDKTPGISDVQINQSILELLGRRNFSLNSILSFGETIEITEKIGVNYGGNSREVTNEAHPEIKPYLEKAAIIMGDPLLGFDFIIPDIYQPPDKQRWGIIECNGLPFINLHHDPHEGTPNNVARYVWDMIEKDVKHYDD